MVEKYNKIRNYGKRFFANLIVKKMLSFFVFLMIDLLTGCCMYDKISVYVHNYAYVVFLKKD